MRKSLKFKISKIKMPKFLKNRSVFTLILTIFISSFFGFLAGAFSGAYFYFQANSYFPIPNVVVQKNYSANQEKTVEYPPQLSREEKIIKAVDNVSPAVVSIIITKDLPVFEENYTSPFEEFFNQPFNFKIPELKQKGTEKKEVGGGSGFIVSKDGIIVTNKHVVLDKEADYTVLTNDGKKFVAKVLARDPVQDLAIIKIEGDNLPTVKLGDSSALQLGQTVIAIGNALGEFKNTISVGVVSGLGRNITASGGGLLETLEGVIQTDAAINKGNSGGPLLNLEGEVVGINTATVMSAQNIGFAISVNKAKKDIEQVKTLGKIIYPFLGVRYVLINEKVKEKKNLPVNYGALIIAGEKGELAVISDSAAGKAGLKENDIILEFNGEKITSENSLAKIIMEYNPGDEINLKILRNEKEMIVKAILGERSE